MGMKLIFPVSFPHSGTKTSQCLLWQTREEGRKHQRGTAIFHYVQTLFNFFFLYYFFCPDKHFSLSYCFFLPLFTPVFTFHLQTNKPQPRTWWAPSFLSFLFTMFISPQPRVLFCLQSPSPTSTDSCPCTSSTSSHACIHVCPCLYHGPMLASTAHT